MGNNYPSETVHSVGCSKQANILLCKQNKVFVDLLENFTLM